MKKDTTNKIPRGFRNHNPLNIRIGNTWLGEVADPTDSDFEQFVSDLYGLRAGFVILRRYIRRYGRNTIRKIISAWAPSNENRTDIYIKFVSDLTHHDPDELIVYEDKPLLVAIVRAMVQMECGSTISIDLVEKAYDMT